MSNNFDIILTESDFKAYRTLPAMIFEEVMHPHIMKAQTIELQSLIGAALYLKHLAGYKNDAKYIALHEGETYTDSLGVVKIFYGIKPMLVYYALGHYALQTPAVATAWGYVTKENEFSTPISDKTLARIENSERATAKFFEQNLINYLNDQSVLDSTKFPDWKNTCLPNRNSNGIKISKINTH